MSTRRAFELGYDEGVETQQHHQSLYVAHVRMEDMGAVSVSVVNVRTRRGLGIV
jgi:hypothetical protein